MGVLLCINLVVIGYCIVLVLWEAPMSAIFTAVLSNCTASTATRAVMWLKLALLNSQI
jgi:hypothetical protein